jgi:tetratricopeptide (TPR) repeat protein
MRELFCALIVAAACGCGTVGGTTFVRAYAAGDRSYSAGRFDEAAKEYAHAAEVAERDRDKEEALYASADALFRAGKTDAALAAFDALAKKRPPGERTFLSAYRAARIRIAQGHEAEGYAALEAIFREDPEGGISHRALRAVVDHVEESKGKAAALAWESALQPTFDGNRLGEEICYDVARRNEDLGNASGALTGYLSCAEKYPYPTGALWDDSLWHASLLHEQLGDPNAAVEDLRRMLKVRESSSFNGTYDRPRMPFAQLRIAELQRDKLADHAAAHASFRKVLDDFPRSILRAKALFESAKMSHEDGDESTACGLANELVDDFSDTRWARKADETCAAVAPKAEALRKAREERRKKEAEAKK